MNQHQLTPEQEQAVIHTGGPLMIVAGAGTGKTTVLTKKIAYLIEQNLAKPEQILALTFTEKAALEMTTRVETELATRYSDIHISTFHSFCQQILETYALDIGLSNQFRLVTEAQAWMLVKENLNSFGLDYYKPLANPGRHIHALIKHFNKCKDELITPEAYLAYAEGETLDGDATPEGERSRVLELANAYHRYQRLLLEHSALDFGDLISYTVRLLEERPNIQAKIKQRFTHVLVDEFQDVNWAQYRLVQLLSSQTSELTVVGDDDQSIYAFRGASVSNILRFKDDYPQARAIVLTQNYRSNQTILDAAYRLIQNNNPDRLEIKLNINKRLSAPLKIAKPDGVEYTHYNSSREEAEEVALSILNLKASEPELIWKDIALLVRANNHALLFQEAFERQGIPYEIMARENLFDTPIVIDALNFFASVINSHNSPAFFRLLHVPMLGARENDLQKLLFSAKKKAISYYEALKRSREFGVSDEGAAIFDKLIAWIHQGMRDVRTTKPSVILYRFLETSGYLNYLASTKAQENQNFLRDIEVLNQFFELLTAYETEHPGKATVAQFLEYYESLNDGGDMGANKRSETDLDRVKIMTVHAAKGLEFRYVYVVNLVEERFPTRRHSDSLEIPEALTKEIPPTGDAHYQEERRLFYVALTRAKEKVFLSSARDFGGVRDKKISRFLAELGYGEESAPQKLKEGALSASIAEPRPPQKLSLEDFEVGTTFSFSQLKSYETCPYQYKLNHILKIPTKGSPNFSFGQSMHLTLQKFYQRVQELNKIKQVSLFAPAQPASEKKEGLKIPTLAELNALYEASWIEDWYDTTEQRERYYAQGKEILTAFYEDQAQNWRIPVTLEGWFKISVGPYLLNGRIDRIDQLGDGTLEIIDYKTGQSKDKLTSEDKQQLLIYQIAAEELAEYRHMGKPSKLTFFYLSATIKKLDFIGTPKELSGLKERLVELIDRIRSKDFTATPSSFACNFCSFKDICEFRAR